MSVETIELGFWANLWRACFGSGSNHQFVLPASRVDALRAVAPVPPPPLIDAPHLRPAAAVRYAVANEAVVPSGDEVGGAATAAASLNFMLSARLASTRVLNVPKHRAGKPPSAITPDKKPDATRKARPKKSDAGAKVLPKARHVWLHGQATAPMAAPSAEIVNFEARPTAAPVAGKAKRAA